MMTNKKLAEFRTPCQYIAGVLQPCVVVKSHLEANAEIKKLKAVVERWKNATRIAVEGMLEAEELKEQLKKALANGKKEK